MGSRVVLRYRLDPDELGQFGETLTDVVGELTHWPPDEDPDGLATVRRRSGEEVAVQRRRIVAAKVIPQVRPQMPATVERRTAPEGEGSDMSANAIDASGLGVPEQLTWDELEQLPDHTADEIELWEGRVFWNRRGPLEHRRFSRRICAAIEANARQAMRKSADEGEASCWEAEVETNIFFTADKSSFLTPDFFVRRCLPRGADMTPADVVLVGEVLSGSDTPKRVEWKKARYADAGIPWYWEVELDTNRSWDIAAVRAYELIVVPAAGLEVKLLRPAIYGLVGEWEPRDVAIEFPKPFDLYISWEDLAF